MEKHDALESEESLTEEQKRPPLAASKQNIKEISLPVKGERDPLIHYQDRGMKALLEKRKPVRRGQGGFKDEGYRHCSGM